MSARFNVKTQPLNTTSFTLWGTVLAGAAARVAIKSTYGTAKDAWLAAFTAIDSPAIMAWCAAGLPLTGELYDAVDVEVSGTFGAGAEYNALKAAADSLIVNTSDINTACDNVLETLLQVYMVAMEYGINADQHNTYDVERVNALRFAFGIMLNAYRAVTVY